MKIKIEGREIKPEVIVIPKLRGSSLKFFILTILYGSENEVLLAEDLAEVTGKTINQIHAAALSLKKDGLVSKFRRYIRITPAGEWYIREYEKLK